MRALCFDHFLFFSSTHTNGSLFHAFPHQKKFTSTSFAFNALSYPFRSHPGLISLKHPIPANSLEHPPQHSTLLNYYFFIGVVVVRYSFRIGPYLSLLSLVLLGWLYTAGCLASLRSTFISVLFEHPFPSRFLILLALALGFGFHIRIDFVAPPTLLTVIQYVFLSGSLVTSLQVGCSESFLERYFTLHSPPPLIISIMCYYYLSDSSVFISFCLRLSSWYLCYQYLLLVPFESICVRDSRIY